MWRTWNYPLFLSSCKPEFCSFLSIIHYLKTEMKDSLQILVRSPLSRHVYLSYATDRSWRQRPVGFDGFGNMGPRER